MAGVGYAAALCWASVCLLASFRPDSLSSPYWSGIPFLRSDTSGIAGLVLAALCLCGSEYLRWRRHAAAAGRLRLPSAEVFALAYQRGRYARLIHYDRPLDLPLHPQDKEWAEKVARGKDPS